MITNPAELEQTIQIVLDGMATQEQLGELRETLKSDSAARQLYYEHAGLHQVLSSRFSHGNASETAHLLTNARLRAQTRRSAKFALLAAAAVVVFAVVFLRGILVPEPEPIATFESANGTILTIQSANPDAESDPGELSEDSLVTLSQGSVELELRNGSRAVILAPAAFNFQSDGKLHLNRGTAWFHIKEKDQGFVVTTAELEVTDLGTEFGVISGPRSSDEVHVFKGRVIARSRNPLQNEEMLEAGHSRYTDPAGRLKYATSRPEAFLVRLPEANTDGLVVNGGFESGKSPADLTYGVPATSSSLPGWRFGREVTVLKAASEGRWANGGSINNRYPLHFGKNPKGLTLYLDGYLDDVAVWNKALSPQDIEALWNRGVGRAAVNVPAAKSLVSNWTFDADLGDAVGARDARAYGDARIETGISKLGPAAAVFDGRGDYLTAGSREDFAIGTGAMSVSFWFKVDKEDVSPSRRFLATGAGLDNETGWTIFMGGASISAGVSDGTGRTILNGNGDGAIDPFDGDWHLAVAVFDAGTATVKNYLDSVPETITQSDTLRGGAVGVNALTILSSTADAQLGFHSEHKGRPDPSEAVIYQSFSTEPGREYEVEFEVGGIFFGRGEVEITASVYSGFSRSGEPLAQHAESRSRQSGNGYNPPARFQFSATSSHTTLVFTETSADSRDADPVLDNVAVRPVGSE